MKPVVSTVGTIADAGLQVVGSGLVSSTAAPVVDGLDSVVSAVPVVGSVVGPAPVASVTDPVLDTVDQALGAAASALAPIVDDVTDTITDDVVAPIVGGDGAGLVPAFESSLSSLASRTAAPLVTSTSTLRSDAAGSGTDAQSARGAAGGNALSPVIPVPFAPMAPAAPSAPLPTSTGAAGSGAAQPASATVEHGFHLTLTAARQAFADDAATPFSPSNDPGSSPD